MYTPNYNNPRVISRIKKALGFVCGVMSETKPHAWSTRHIDEYLGSQRNDLSKWLRGQLLICTDDFYRFNIPGEKGICKKYILNKEGVRNLREILKITQHTIYPIVVKVAKTDFTKELTSGNFPYEDKSGRLWHPLQRYRRQYKQEILAEFGYQHQYDIQCCAPTLIHQYAQHLGMDQYLFALRKYLADRQSIRQELALKTELPIEAVKEVINALFAGAHLSKHPESDIYEILNGDIARIEYLKQDPFLTELREDIKICWNYITPHLSRRRNNKTNRLLPVNAKQKWNVYFELERSVLNSVRIYLENKSIRCFLEHDGWTCDKEVDLEELREFVKKDTGYEIKLDYVKINNIQQLPYCSESLS